MKAVDIQCKLFSDLISQRKRVLQNRGYIKLLTKGLKLTEQNPRSMLDWESWVCSWCCIWHGGWWSGKMYRTGHLDQWYPSHADHELHAPPDCISSRVPSKMYKIYKIVCQKHDMPKSIVQAILQQSLQLFLYKIVIQRNTWIWA